MASLMPLTIRLTLSKLTSHSTIQKNEGDAAHLLHIRQETNEEYRLHHSSGFWIVEVPFDSMGSESCFKLNAEKCDFSSLRKWPFTPMTMGIEGVQTTSRTFSCCR